MPVPPVVVVVVSPVLYEPMNAINAWNSKEEVENVYPLQWLFELVGKHER
jgi:hypothetical protein